MVSQTELISKGYHSLVLVFFHFFRDGMGPFKFICIYSSFTDETISYGQPMVKHSQQTSEKLKSVTTKSSIQGNKL